MTLTHKVGSVIISLDVVLCLKVKSSWPSFTSNGLKIDQWLGTKVKQEYKRKPYYLVPKYEGRGNVENDGVLNKGECNFTELNYPTVRRLKRGLGMSNTRLFTKKGQC